MDRLWSRIGIRAVSVGLLVAGAAGGVYLGQDRDAGAAPSASSLVVQTEADDLRLLKIRANEHAAARAWQREAESGAAAKAATEARTAAGRAHALEKRVVAAKKAAKAKAANATVPYTGPIPGSCKEFSGNRATGCALMLQKGFGIAEFPCLNKLWDHESGWNHKAANPSGAYGIPQALPGSKMKSEGADWKTNPATQIKWGMGYIKGKYDSPCGAWSYFQGHGHY